MRPWDDDPDGGWDDPDAGWDAYGDGPDGDDWQDDDDGEPIDFDAGGWIRLDRNVTDVDGVPAPVLGSVNVMGLPAGRTRLSAILVRRLQAQGDPMCLTEGLRYARAGNVLAIRMFAGSVQAAVQGSRENPYLTEMAFPEMTDAYRQVFAEMAAGLAPDALTTAAVPEGLAAVLIPRVGELRFSCNCPDWGNPCKHAVALCQSYGRYLDRNPHSVLRVRGFTAAELRRIAPGLAPDPELYQCMVGFYVPSGEFPAPPTATGHSAYQEMDPALLQAGLIRAGVDREHAAKAVAAVAECYRVLTTAGPASGAVSPPTAGEGGSDGSS